MRWIARVSERRYPCAGILADLGPPKVNSDTPSGGDPLTAESRLAFDLSLLTAFWLRYGQLYVSLYFLLFLCAQMFELCLVCMCVQFTVSSAIAWDV